MSDSWDIVKMIVGTSKGISFDGCHKIYILMDDESLADQYKCGYGKDEGTFCIEVEAKDIETHFNTVKTWWSDSCGLRFINAVSNGGHKSEDFVSIIGQFEDEDE